MRTFRPGGLLAVLAAAVTAITLAATPAGAVTTLLDEDFHTLTVGTSFAEGASIGTTFTDVFNGGGTQKITSDGTNKFLTQQPQTSTSPGETHAALATSASSFSGSYTLLAEYGNETQLRTGSTPNAWERGWLLFDYTGNNSFYNVVLKSNGWELDKEYANSSGQQQCFLASGTTPTYSLSSWKRIVVTQTVSGATTTLKVQARTGSNALTTLTTFTDNGNAANCPGVPALSSGKVGAYTEDAQVDWGWFRVTQ
jgi:hypothetical protein